MYDYTGDGFANRTTWVAGNDGIFVYDKNNDGNIKDHDELSFIGYVDGAKTDLEGLRHFDTNGDNILDSRDAEWGKFKIWQDKNQNGITDEGELRTLQSLGIVSLSLVSDGITYQNETATIHGETTFTHEDGSTSQGFDASFAVSETSLKIEIYEDAVQALIKNEDGDISKIITYTDDDDHTLTIYDGNGIKGVLGGNGVDRFTLDGSENGALFGMGGDDILNGGGGNDVLHGGGGADRLNGGGGDDVLIGDVHDHVDGGAGQDTFILQHDAGDEPVHIYMEQAPVDATTGPHITITNIETVIGHDGDNMIMAGRVLDHGVALYGLGGDDILIGYDGNDHLDGGDGNDILMAQNGNNVVMGGAGDDTIKVKYGNDRVDGGEGIDALIFADEIDTNKGSAKVDLSGSLYSWNEDANTFTEGSGEGYVWHRLYRDFNRNGQEDNGDRFSFVKNIEQAQILTQGGDDEITGSAGDDLIITNGGNDTIDGGGGNDRIYGGDGNDILFDIEGINLLDGGAGDDHLTGENTIYRGGEGDDLFVMRNALNFIEDFGLGNDKIHINIEALTGLTPAELGSKPLLQVVRTFVDTGRQANDATIGDVIIYDARLTADRTDDIALLVLEDYEGPISLAQFEIV